MRSRPWIAFILIMIIASAATWVALPGEMLDVGGFKAAHPIQQGLDLQGGVQVTLEARPPAGQSVSSSELEGTRDTIEKRVSGLGVSEAVVQTRGSNQIIVELPGVDDPEEAVRVVQRTALLEIIDPQGQRLPEGMLVNTTLGTADSLLAEATPVASPGASPVNADGTPVAAVEPTPLSNTPIYTTIISGADLKDAYPTTNALGQTVVGFELNSDAADRFYEFTSQNIGQPMSILLDKAVISSPSINSAISSQGIIEGMPADEVNNLVVQLQAGALAVPLEVVASRTVGPSLGQDSIDASLLAAIIGLGTVGLFMILYYRLPGAVSVIALLIYTAITLSIFKLLPVTLTLAGIAGFILSIGMAVDANVLIFARLKEELRAGRNLPSGIEASFDHAWPSIRDSNISSMITAVILWWFGNYTGASIITGFALTLFLGVMVSMFTAIIVTKNLMRLTVAAGFDQYPWLYGVEKDQTAMAQSPAD